MISLALPQEPQGFVILPQLKILLAYFSEPAHMMGSYKYLCQTDSFSQCVVSLIFNVSINVFFFFLIIVSNCQYCLIDNTNMKKKMFLVKRKTLKVVMSICLSSLICWVYKFCITIIVPFKSLGSVKWIFLLSIWLKVTVKIFILLQTIFILNKCCSFELSVYHRIIFHKIIK